MAEGDSGAAGAGAGTEEAEVQGSIPKALRELVKGAGGKPVALKDVAAWKEYGDRVVVVTKDGQKLVGEKAGK